MNHRDKNTHYTHKALEYLHRGKSAMATRFIEKAIASSSEDPEDDDSLEDNKELSVSEILKQATNLLRRGNSSLAQYKINKVIAVFDAKATTPPYIGKKDMNGKNGPQKLFSDNPSEYKAFLKRAQKIASVLGKTQKMFALEWEKVETFAEREDVHFPTVKKALFRKLKKDANKLSDQMYEVTESITDLADSGFGNIGLEKKYK